MQLAGGRKGSASVALIGALVVLAAIIGFVAWYKLWREVPQHFDSPVERFKYGSIGTEAEEGIPYWIWLVLPRVFPEYLPDEPGGYKTLGMQWEAGHEMPVGFSKKTIGFPRVGINCALCHTTAYRRTTSEQPPELVPTGPANTFDSLAYQRFLFACASDPRFNADVLLEAIEYHIDLSWFNELFYRYVLIPETREALLEQKQRYAWTNQRPDWGPGRIDPFNPVKFNQLGLSPEGDETIGNSDMMPLWNLAQHEGHAYHWDGLNTSLREVVLSSAIGDGATPESLPIEDLKALESWLKEVSPPDYPFPIDQGLARQGEELYGQYCAQCHAFDGEKTGKVLPLQEVGTDRHRLDMWTEEAAEAYNAYADGYAWDFEEFRTTKGYVSVPLDGIWLRAPYLHNGSVPTLWDLLHPAPQKEQMEEFDLNKVSAGTRRPVSKIVQKARTMGVRPPIFYSGGEVYNPKRVGFRSASSGNKSLFRFDTRLPGNGNGGHAGKRYGTKLSPQQKRALLEYLKTL